MIYDGVKLRHEEKYFISKVGQMLIRQRLKDAMMIDANTDENNEYTVTSLYLDDMYETAYYEKLSGVMHRHKYRIRMYKYNPDSLKLEKKIKHGEYIGKLSCGLNKQQYNAIISGRNAHILLDSEEKLLHEVFSEIRNARLAPRVVVEYDREVYILNEGNVRITFDHRLRAGIKSLDITKLDYNKISADHADRVIMEVKYDAFLPKHVRSLLTADGRERLSISKYVICSDIERLYGGCFYEGQHTIVPRHI
jgi:SPX domain protein involved in polyphosphate accumulation